MITTAELYAFIRAFPKFIDFMKTAYGEFIKLQIHVAEAEKDKKIEQLEKDLASLKNAKTNAEIATTIATINSR